MLFVAGYAWGPLFSVALTAFVLVVALLLADVLLLYQRDAGVKAERRLPKMFSLGDANRVALRLTNLTPRPLRLTVIDELPVQFQKRDFEKKHKRTG